MSETLVSSRKDLRRSAGRRSPSITGGSHKAEDGVDSSRNATQNKAGRRWKKKDKEKEIVLDSFSDDDALGPPRPVFRNLPPVVPRRRVAPERSRSEPVIQAPRVGQVIQAPKDKAADCAVRTEKLTSLIHGLSRKPFVVRVGGMCSGFCVTFLAFFYFTIFRRILTRIHLLAPMRHSRIPNPVEGLRDVIDDVSDGEGFVFPVLSYKLKAPPKKLHNDDFLSFNIKFDWGSNWLWAALKLGLASSTTGILLYYLSKLYFFTVFEGIPILVLVVYALRMIVVVPRFALGDRVVQLRFGETSTEESADLRNYATTSTDVYVGVLSNSVSVRERVYKENPHAVASGLPLVSVMEYDHAHYVEERDYEIQVSMSMVSDLLHACVHHSSLSFKEMHAMMSTKAGSLYHINFDMVDMLTSQHGHIVNNSVYVASLLAMKARENIDCFPTSHL
jgi:hypothetical protein